MDCPAHGESEQGCDFDFATTQPQCLEHSELAWVSDDELLAYDLAPSDRKFAEYRLRELRSLSQEPTK